MDEISQLAYLPDGRSYLNQIEETMTDLIAREVLRAVRVYPAAD